MVRAINERVTVKPGGLIEIRRPDLPTGATAEVLVLVEEHAHPPRSFASLVGKVRGCFADGQEADAFLRAERDSWDR